MVRNTEYRTGEINASLPKNRKIRVISISLGIDDRQKKIDQVMNEIREAEKQNIYVAYVGSDPFLGMYRDPVKNPNDLDSYGPGLFWRKHYYEAADWYSREIMVPMDSRCTASPTGASDYAFYASGGMSWAVPYVAGLYALACQAYPELTPKLFWDIAASTGTTAQFGIIINPSGIIEALSKNR